MRQDQQGRKVTKGPRELLVHRAPLERMGPLGPLARRAKLLRELQDLRVPRAPLVSQAQPGHRVQLVLVSLAPRVLKVMMGLPAPQGLKEIRVHLVSLGLLVLMEPRVLKVMTASQVLLALKVLLDRLALRVAMGSRVPLDHKGQRVRTGLRALLVHRVPQGSREIKVLLASPEQLDLKATMV